MKANDPLPAGQGHPPLAFLRALSLALETDSGSADAAIDALLRAKDPTRPGGEEKEQFWKQMFSHGTFSPLPSSLRVPPTEDESPTGIQKIQLVDGLSYATTKAGCARADFWLAVWGIVLARYTGESVVTFGVPQTYSFSGERNVPMRWSAVLPLSLAYEGQRSFREWMQVVCQARQEAHRGGPVTLEAIRQWVGLTPSAPLFESQVVPDLEPVGGGLSFEPEEARPLVTLRLPMGATAPVLEWDVARFDRQAAARLAGHLETIARAFAENPDRKCGEVPLITAGEWQEIVVDWNSARAEYAPGRAIHELIEDQAARMPDAIAASCDGKELSYRELNRRADVLAQRLIALGVKPDTLVPICVSRSVDMIVGIVGIMKAGGAYVPIDANYPVDRRAFVLEDVASSLLVTESGLVETLSAKDLTLLLVDDETPLQGAAQPLPKVAPDNLAYAIYTSGSTGKPKGVLISHRNLASSLAARLAYHDPGSTNFLLLWSYAFDGSVAGIFWMLATGGKLTIVPEGAQQDITRIDHLISVQGVTTIGSLPPVYSLLLDRWQMAPPPSLRCVIVAGEACPPKLVAQHQLQVPQAVLHNEYGPTEGTVWCTVHRCDTPVRSTSVPIGHAIPNTGVYLLDANFQPVPVGIAGEICIGGGGIAKGYLNRPELTAERFVPNPFVPGQRLYLTGDYGRFQPNGAIEFLGRRDQQVKVRGFRVELGEIESVLAQAPGVNECLVLVREDQPGNQRLVAYVTMQLGVEFSIPELRHFVRLQLPEYMVPVAVVRLDHFPLSAVGKVDRKALPPPDPNAALCSAPFRPPGNVLEQQIAEIWKKELNLATVGIEDNFFDIGGHSLALMRVHQHLQKTLSREIPITELFRNSTIRSLASQLDQKMTRTSLGDRTQARAKQLRAALSRSRRPSGTTNRTR